MAYKRYYYKKLASLGRFPGVGHVLHLISASGKSALISTVAGPDCGPIVTSL